MRMKCMQIAFVLIAMAGLCAAAQAQTDIAASFYRTFTGSSTGYGTNQSPSEDFGGMFELRHISKPLIGYEITYAVNPSDQAYSTNKATCNLNCSNPPTTSTSFEHQVSIDWVPSLKVGNLRPFAVGGIGFSMFVPRNNTVNFNTTVDVVRATFVAGGGLDWGFLPRAGLRLQLRDDIYKAPNLSIPFNATGAYTHSVKPMIGIYFRL